MLNNKDINWLIVLFGLMFFFMLVSCHKEEINSRPRVEIRLTDKPADFQQVNIEIKGVEIHIVSDEGKGAWYTLHINSGIYNLLDFTGGKDTLLSSEEIPTGKIRQIRLLLGSNNSIMKDNSLHTLEFLGDKQISIKLQNADLKEGATFKLLLDFDASRSIVVNKMKFILKPVLRAVFEAQTGGIKGHLVPSSKSASIYAIEGTDTVGTYTDKGGKFLIKGLRNGKYRIVIEPTNELEAIEKKDVVVNPGAITDIGIIKLK